MNLTERRRVIDHFKTANIWTTHLKPADRNFRVYVKDVTNQSANRIYARNGYLGITVRQHYFIRHNRQLRHHYLPCAVQHGGKGHRNYYPLEVLEIHVNPNQLPVSIQ